MPREKGRSVFVAIVWVTTALLASCQPAPPLATSTSPGISVGIADDLCPSVSVQAGQQVTWTNQGNHEYRIREQSVDGKSRFDSGPLKPGDSFAFTFMQPQIYQYECSADGSLMGTITVEP